MDNQQAKQILQCYRPNTSDANDPHFAEALEQAKRDPELARWLEQQAALDTAIRSKFKQAAPPADLKERILASRNVVRPVFWTRPRTLFALAASVAFIAVVAGIAIQSSHRHSYSAYRAEMVQFVSNEYKMDLKTGDLAQLRTILASKQWPSDYVVPKPLEKVELEGGCALQWQGHKVALICWEGEKDIWLFVTERASLPDAPANDTPKFTKVGKLTTVSWTLGSCSYLLASEMDESTLRKLM